MPSPLRKYSFIVRPLPLLFVLVAGIIGCNSSLVFGVEAKGEAARISWFFSEGVGGQGFETSMEVDSASGQYALRRCQGPFTSACVTTEERAGTVPPAVLLELFEVAQSREFRELKSEYRLPGDIVPPDGGGTQLVAVVGERRKAVSWQKGAQIPDVLHTFGCLMLAATESLLCD